jgi:pimeloyl-ACP methyl ester carboxylesterase
MRGIAGDRMLRWVRALCRGWGFVAVWLAIAMAAQPARAESVARSTGYFVTLQPDNQPPLKIYVEEMGSGPVILMLHGLGGSSYSWRHVAPRLATTHRVIALDLRGFGRSDKPFDQSYAPADHAAVVRATIKALNLSRITLAGHSFGGMVALMVAMDRRLEPHRIAKLVTLAAPAYPQTFSAGVRFLNKPLIPYLALLMVPSEVIATITLMTEKFGFDRYSNQDISIYADPLTDPGGPHALIATARHIVPPDLHRIIARYGTIAKPTLVLWCREDQVVPVSTGERLARAIPNARLAVMEGCDHMPAEQAPQAVVREIRRFLDR